MGGDGEKNALLENTAAHAVDDEVTDSVDTGMPTLQTVRLLPYDPSPRGKG